MKLIILTSRALPLQTSLHLPFKITSTCLQFNPIPLTRFIYSLFPDVPDTFLVFFLWFSPSWSVSFKTKLLSRKLFIWIFQLAWPLSALPLRLTYVDLWQLLSGEMTLLFMLPGVYISSHPVTLSYPPLQRLCLCLCLSLCLPRKMWCIQWTFTPSVFPTQVILDLKGSTWLTCVGQTQEEDWSPCFAPFQVTIQFRAKSQALKPCVLSHHCFILMREPMISRGMMILWRDVEIHDCLP